VCYSLWYNAPTMLPVGPEDGPDQRPKYVQLIGIINKSLMCASSWCLYHLCIHKFRTWSFLSLNYSGVKWSLTKF